LQASVSSLLQHLHKQLYYHGKWRRAGPTNILDVIRVHRNCLIWLKFLPVMESSTHPSSPRTSKKLEYRTIIVVKNVLEYSYSKICTRVRELHYWNLLLQ